MCNHFDDNNQREIFVNTIQEKIIGPGADIFGIDKEFELVATNPVKLYYSGVLFSKAFSNPEAVTEDGNDVDENEVDENELIINNPLNDGAADNDIENNQQLDGQKDDIESANLRFQSFFPNKFGLTFAVNQATDLIKIIFNFATYKLVSERKLKITAAEWELLQAALPSLNENLVIRQDFGTDFFALDKFNFENEVLTFTYNPSNDINLSDKKYKDCINTAFHNIPNLSKRFVKNLCAKKVFERKPFSWAHTLAFTEIMNTPITIPNAKLQLFTKVIETDAKKIVKLLIQNNSTADKKSYKDCYFQVQLKVESNEITDYKKHISSVVDEDYATVDYQYQDIKSYGKGVGCAVKWKEGESIETTFLPEEEIKNFSNAPNKSINDAGIADIFKLKNLSIWTNLNNTEIIEKLTQFSDIYNDWQRSQNDLANGDPIGIAIVQKQELAINRLKNNITYLSQNNDVFESFKLANTAMMLQMIIAKDDRFKKGRDFLEGNFNEENKFNDLNFFKNYDGQNEPTYRPFQLAFLLMNIESTFNKQSEDRNDIVDLIWFPTGGGKTEAYLALTALTIIERRRHNKDKDKDTSGVSVMMRYTLRLLTAQQFERATYLICALEFLRNKSPECNLGTDEITIGMWVGGTTTPNAFDDLKNFPWNRIFDASDLGAAKAGNKFPISYCPWCGFNLISEKDGILKIGYEKQTQGNNINGLTVYCINDSCHFESQLPISFIDEQLYKTPPTILFATVDKMVRLSHKQEVGNLFNSPLPIDLIIQDELHLLTGPLGSLKALYELAIEQLYNSNERKPKIVASTATTRNTASVIKSMYGRELNVFPAQGVRFDDNFFSYLDHNAKRKHIGVMPTGKTAGLTEIKIVEALFEAKIKLLLCFLSDKGVDVNQVSALLEALNSDDFKTNMDPYWSFVFYYNNLRDLGRSKSRVSIDFTQQIVGMFDEKGFSKNLKFVLKNLFSRTVEFTSRQESEKIKSLLTRTEQKVSFTEFIYNDNTYIKEQEGCIDLALASNMFSVGIDVNRLNIMLMMGQPGSVAEYIQASSRVARKDKGLVINLLNPMRIREFSIFEDYKAFHASYYKNVEPLSITPFTQMAVDKLLDAVLVAYVRHVCNVQNVQDYNPKMKDALFNIIVRANRCLSDGQKAYLSAKLNHLSAMWIAGQGKDGILITKNQYKNGIFDPMNSLRDIDYDVFIENKSL
jgi:hypothetical protein